MPSIGLVAKVLQLTDVLSLSKKQLSRGWTTFHRPLDSCKRKRRLEFYCTFHLILRMYLQPFWSVKPGSQFVHSNPLGIIMWYWADGPSDVGWEINIGQDLWKNIVPLHWSSARWSLTLSCQRNSHFVSLRSDHWAHVYPTLIPLYSLHIVPTLCYSYTHWG